MAWWSKLKLSTKLSLLVGVFLAAFLAFGWRVYSTIDRIRVGGPIYQQIVDGKDVISDILPPPEYIIESYLVALELAEETDPAAVPDLISRSARLRREYEERHAYWSTQLKDPGLRKLMLEDAYRPAMEFFDQRDRELLPLVEPGPARDQVKALQLARGALRVKYQEQRAAVNRLVDAATAYNVQQEGDATDELHAATIGLLVLGLMVIGVVVVMWLVNTRIASRLTRQLRTATAAAGRVADGDLSMATEVKSDDEAGLLLTAIGAMTQSLNSLVSRVKRGSIELMSTATQLSATSREQESVTSSFGASTTEIVAAVKQITATSDQLLSTMEEVTQGAADTAETAQAGSAGLRRMDETMGQLSRATTSISSKLATIREKAAEVNVVITTITKVADHTNLLSVNAAIEAEKAGEYGRGFLVLAREIRRLADQTAVATLDIERMVKDVQVAVSAGVMEMDKFSEEVRQCTSSVASIGGQIGQIIGQVQGLSERFEMVADGMRSQSQGARQINDAMTQLAEGARQSGAAVKEVNSAAHSLRDAVDGLKQEISHFKLAG